MTKPEPLKGKKPNSNKIAPIFNYMEIKSALEWMIAIHEERIEELIEEWQSIELSISINPFEHDVVYTERIDNEYEAIMILEEGLSDVI